MTQSMTGFARLDAYNSQGTWTWELRSVNSRFLDAHLRLPEAFRVLETQVREKLRQQITRGKVECTLTFTANTQAEAPKVNIDHVNHLLSALQQIEKQMGPSQAATSPMELLRWPGVLDTAELDLQTTQADVLETLSEALLSLQRMRKREGQALSEQLHHRLDKIDTIVEQVVAYLPEMMQQQRQQLHTKCQEVALDLDPERLEQEIVLLAQKADVAEELDRLRVHTQEIRRILTLAEPIGRRLDFMMQELNREANTLSSKAIVTDTTQAAVELKVLIEQMREQVQNIE